jgi:trans-aconitate methyltransferase
MNFDDPRYRECFFRLHQGLPRQGPGSRACTLRALELCGPLRQDCRVLDLGCGPGAQTLDLVQALPGAELTAVDLHGPFLEELSERVAQAGCAERVGIQQADMGQLAFPAESFHLIWSEGAAYSIGFGRALALWRPLLATYGCLAVSELCWIHEDPPASLRAMWEKDYPPMTDREGCRALAREQGYQILGDFVLPPEAWWEYYNPLERRCRELESHPDFQHSAGRAVLEDTLKEVSGYRQGSDYYSYLFLVLAPDSP